MKKILFSATLIIFFAFQYYVGLFNSSIIKINDIMINTPSRYYISRGIKNFNTLDFSCNFSIGCQKEFTLPVDDKHFNSIQIIYMKFLSEDILTLSLVTSKKNITMLKKKFFKNKNILNINQCLIDKEYDQGIYNYSFQFNQNIFIRITASEKEIAEKYLKQLCI